MAGVRSLGIHTPTALPYLVDEGLLSPEASETSYNWQVLPPDDPDGKQDEEELLCTQSCVVWSTGGVVQRLFRFDVEGEAVVQAVLTRFPSTLEKSSQRTSVKASSYKPTSRGVQHVLQNSERSELPVQRLFGKSSNHTVPGHSQRSERDERALVVILKSQAHVFFLYGTSYIVHLPFEVSAAFALPRGVLLQRRSAERSGQGLTPLLPPVPSNSFAFSNPSWSMNNSLPLQNLVKSGNSMYDSDHFQSMFKNVLDQSDKSVDVDLPRLLCLTDPLSELGMVGEMKRSNSNQLRGKTPSSTTTLNPAEEVLYISSSDELELGRVASTIQVPLVFALTIHQDTGLYTLWTVSHAAPQSRRRSKGRQSSASGLHSRRRSSYAAGVTTGATTPALRTSIGPAESFVNGNTLKADKGLAEEAEDTLASQLDPAFENPGNQAKSSRRVSSLLARSDLSTNRDRTTLSDLATAHGHAAGNSLKRGPSLGNHPIRSSFGVSSEYQPDIHRTNLGSHVSYQEGSSFLKRSQTKDDEIESDDDLKSIAKGSSGSGIQSLRSETVFTKINSYQGPASVSVHRAKPLRVFTIERPRHRTHESSTQLVMCIMDSHNRQFTTLLMSVAEGPSVRAKDAYSHDDQWPHNVRLNDVKRSEGVLDACKVNDGSSSRILVLCETRDGNRELFLQTPWNITKKLKLPPKLLVHNPYQTSRLDSFSSRREGGLNRVLSEGPGVLLNLEHTHRTNRVDIIDVKNFRHRIEVQLQATNHLVRKALGVCEYVLPGEDAEIEPYTRAWWDVVECLRSRSIGANEAEWTAFVVLLFSMFVESTSDRQHQSTLRHKKRKGGLLRSSSGVSTDLESWNAMMVSEGDPSGSSPSWLKGAAWAWTQNIEQTSVSPMLAQKVRASRSSGSNTADRTPTIAKSTFLVDCFNIAHEFVKSEAGSLAFGERGYLPTARSKAPALRRAALPTILAALHLLREELKLDVLASTDVHQLTPVLAQMGGWLDWETWSWRSNSYYMLESDCMEHWLFDESIISNSNKSPEIMEPPSIFSHVEQTRLGVKHTKFITLLDIITEQPSSNDGKEFQLRMLTELSPRTMMVSDLLNSKPQHIAEHLGSLVASGLNLSVLDSFPEGIAAPLRASISACQADPVTTWSRSVLAMIDREEIVNLEQPDQVSKPQIKHAASHAHESLRDVHTICSSTFETDSVGAYEGSAEADRQSITRMIFKDDQIFAEAMKLVHPLRHAVVHCVPEPDWSDTDLLEAQQELAKTIAVRTLSVSAGRGMMFFSARFPLLTERFPMHGFSLSCVMKPTNTTVTVERSVYSEEKVSWAFFHAGVEAGLSISKEAKGIDTSWILFNKPAELQNRHAGFLLALGLNGHLRTIAKWVAFKYLTPKHTMTSIGLLLGLAASYLGSMDTLITRLLSVHVTRMLPPGAAELNLSPLTQTTGIMAIGLLYCNTQHRRMSEIMLSEMENTEQDDNVSPMDNLRDEGYRLAAGFALGYINLGQGSSLKGLHDMHIVERLLALAVGTRKVDIVHILDKATASAVVAVGLIFMKTQDEALAKKVDIPDTIHQFDYVRPDIFLLRTVARHLIMWNGISATTWWIREQLPLSYQSQVKLTNIRALKTEDMPLLNIVAGLCFSIGLRFAGTAEKRVRDLLGHYLDQFIRICKLPALNYDGKLTRITARNCQDTVSLALASVMAGTGDLYTFRRLRLLHSRSDADTPYGSHLATHMAIGVLFLAGGTHSFNTSNIAIASLLCAFYPLFPTTVLDNKSHLQAFRHFWVLAAEPRCLVIRDADTHRPLPLPIVITLRSGVEMSATAPCLLPELNSIARISSDDPKYWRVTVDFMGNPAHLPAFKRHQSMYVRRRGAYDAHASVFSATLQALNDVQIAQQGRKQIFEWIFDLPAFQGFDRAERALVLPAEGVVALYSRTRCTVVDDRLMLEKGCLGSGLAERLWNLRVLFAWADAVRKRGDKLGWLGEEVVERVRAAVWLMATEAKEEIE
ncbi:Anaphase-promoting complex subunit 1 [Lambiella insularis]|nr:Anaphase-promoting complex subunit 1 [Lambiella insularis]